MFAKGRVLHGSAAKHEALRQRDAARLRRRRVAGRALKFIAKLRALKTRAAYLIEVRFDEKARLEEEALAARLAVDKAEQDAEESHCAAAEAAERATFEERAAAEAATAAEADACRAAEENERARRKAEEGEQADAAFKAESEVDADASARMAADDEVRRKADDEAAAADMLNREEESIKAEAPTKAAALAAAAEERAHASAARAREASAHATGAALLATEAHKLAETRGNELLDVRQRAKAAEAALLRLSTAMLIGALVSAARAVAERLRKAAALKAGVDLDDDGGQDPIQAAVVALLAIQRVARGLIARAHARRARLGRMLVAHAAARVLQERARSRFIWLLFGRQRRAVMLIQLAHRHAVARRARAEASRQRSVAQARLRIAARAAARRRLRIKHHVAALLQAAARARAARRERARRQRRMRERRAAVTIQASARGRDARQTAALLRRFGTYEQAAAKRANDARRLAAVDVLSARAASAARDAALCAAREASCVASLSAQLSSSSMRQPHQQPPSADESAAGWRERQAARDALDDAHARRLVCEELGWLKAAEHAQAQADAHFLAKPLLLRSLAPARLRHAHGEAAMPLLPHTRRQELKQYPLAELHVRALPEQIRFCGWDGTQWSATIVPKRIGRGAQPTQHIGSSDGRQDAGHGHRARELDCKVCLELRVALGSGEGCSALWHSRPALRWVDASGRLHETRLQQSAHGEWLFVSSLPCEPANVERAELGGARALPWVEVTDWHGRAVTCLLVARSGRELAASRQPLSRPTVEAPPAAASAAHAYTLAKRHPVRALTSSMSTLRSLPLLDERQLAWQLHKSAQRAVEPPAQSVDASPWRWLEGASFDELLALPSKAAPLPLPSLPPRRRSCAAS